MSLAAHCFQGYHARALRNQPAASDPGINVVELEEVLSRCRVVVCALSLEAPDLATLREHVPPMCEVYASVNAHAWPKTIGIGNPTMDEFRTRTHSAIQEDSFPEYKLGLAAYETVAQVAHDMATARGFTGVYWDEHWYVMPDWVAAPWANKGVTARTAILRWNACRDHLSLNGKPQKLSNVGSAGGGISKRFFNPVSIEEEHGTLAELVSCLVPIQDDRCTIWPDAHEWDRRSFLYAKAPEIEGLVCRGCMLPQE